MKEKCHDIDEIQPDYLVEIYRIWNCDRCRWAIMSPLLFRMESDDYLVWLEGEDILSSKGAIDTQRFSDEYNHFCERDKVDSKTKDAYCWLRDSDIADTGDCIDADGIKAITESYFEASEV